MCRPMKRLLWSPLALSSLLIFALPACTADDMADAGDDVGDTADTTTDDTTDTGTDTDTDTGMVPLTGEELYTMQCAVCHGPTGEGTDIAYEIRHPHGPFSAWVVRNGRTSIEFAGQAMPAFHPDMIPDNDLAQIFVYLDSFEQPTTGEGLYIDYCRNCHGADANGGVAQHSLKFAPLAEYIQLVRSGVGGTNYTMRTKYMSERPAEKLSDAEIGLIYDYVHSL